MKKQLHNKILIYVIKTKLFLLFAILNVSIATAQTFTENGVKYTVLPSTTNVEVVQKSPAYTGEITIPSSVIYNSVTYTVTSIGPQAFFYCTDLTSVAIPTSVTSIEYSAFSNCTSLTSLSIPNSVTSIGQAAFSYCTSLTSLMIPNSVTSIGESAFAGCSGLTDVTISNSITSIELDTFNNCNGLTSVTIPNSVTSIGVGAFNGCNSLTSVTIPNSVTSIGAVAFYDCSSLTSVTIPNSVTSIGTVAFYNCISLTTVNCAVVTPLAIDADVFGNVNQAICALNVPAGSVGLYQAAAVWKDFNPINGAMFSQTTYTVNSTGDLPDNNINDAVCADANGDCTLRAAIQNANKTSNKDIIEFNIPGNAPFVITVTDVMQPIQQPVIIDGKTQAGYANTPLIEIDGSSLVEGKNGLQLIGSSGGSEIYGLSIGGFKRLEVSPFSFGFGVLANTGNHIIQSNYIGIKPDGATINSNTGGGLYFNNTGGNVIGGTQPNQGNVISGNGVGGLTFQGSTTNSAATNNLIQGNLIGTDATGTLNKGNRFNVQFIDAPNNILGGNTAASRNIISGANASDDNTVGTGIAITGSESYGNTIIGNFIGTDITGTLSIPNVRGGIFMLFGANNNLIGTDAVGEGNLISGNGFYGIYLQGGVGIDPVASNSIKGNYIGIDITGNQALSNGRGIMMLTGDIEGNIIGGTTPNSKNVISGNSSAGIAIFSGENNQILGNYIGTNASGTIALTNNTGIDLRSGNNSVGGSANGSRNIVSGNYIGIEISGITSSGCSIKGNYIGLNASGNAALANTSGVSLLSSSSNCVIGGPNTSDRNIISGNAIRGLSISGVSHTIQNNYIGLNPAGNGIIKNGNEGIRFNGTSTDTQVSENTISGNGTVSTSAINVNFNAANNVHFFSNKVGILPDGITGVVNIGNGLFFNSSSNNIIGGASEIEGNIIGNHNLNAIAMAGASSNNTVSYNKIGVGLDGISEIGNTIIGIAISGANTGNTISHNMIANNDRGVVLQASGGIPSQVTISENSMYNNSVIGIDLVGTTANDVDDADTGVNNLQNTPEISGINYLGGGAIEITYAVPSSVTNSAYPLLIEFFGAASGQGKFFIDSDLYITPGSKTITLNLPNGFDQNDYNNIVATATDANANTSEFGDSINYTLSVSPIISQSIKLYPNPVSDRLFIQFSSSDTFNLELFNFLGQIVLTENSVTSSTSLNVSSLSKGLYFLNVNSENGSSQTIKFIKN